MNVFRNAQVHAPTARPAHIGGVLVARPFPALVQKLLKVGTSVYRASI